MRIEITIVDERDQDELHHLIWCEVHRPEFLWRLMRLFNDAAVAPDPGCLTLTITGIDTDHKEERHAD